MLNGWLFLLLVPFAGVAMASILDSDDDDVRDTPPQLEPEPEPEPENLIQGTDGDDNLSTPDGFGGLVDGGAGDDMLELNSKYDPDQPAGLGNEGYYPHQVIDALGPDNEREWSWRENDGWTFWRPFRVDAAPGPDELPSGLIAGFGGDGDDSIRASGYGGYINGGAGADSMDVAGLTGAEVWLDSDDSLGGYDESSTGVTIGLTDVAEFTGHDGAETSF